MPKRPLEVAEQYLSAWKNKDANAIRNLIHPDIRLKNPDSEITGRGAYMKTVEKLMPLLEGLNVRAKFESGNQVMLAYDFYLSEPVKVSSVANLMTVEDGLIRSVELFMDFRPFSQPTPQERQKKSA